MQLLMCLTYDGSRAYDDAVVMIAAVAPLLFQSHCQLLRAVQRCWIHSLDSSISFVSSLAVGYLLSASPSACVVPLRTVGPVAGWIH